MILRGVALRVLAPSFCRRVAASYLLRKSSHSMIIESTSVSMRVIVANPSLRFWRTKARRCLVSTLDGTGGRSIAKRLDASALIFVASLFALLGLLVERVQPVISRIENPRRRPLVDRFL